MAQISLSRLPWWGQITAFAILSGAAVFGFWFYYVSDVTAEMATREARLQQLRTDITRGLNTAKRLPEFQAGVDDLERRLEALKSVLPEQKDYADILRRVQTLATQSNLTIRGFQPKPVETKQIHEEWPIVLELDGTYHNLGMFFDRISKFPRIINVNALKIRSKDQPSANSTISAECTALTFVLVDSTKAAPAKPGMKPTPPRPAAGKAGP
ncbi:MAG TPA: type 4a pilus biogenesis protein PilO [Vicinamibacterales bacterium]|jgi:type IV pilus assembly protein PilO|nr:type 4a pilus biogenesis protein PilO [Vicinamibacterales bacterium]